MTGAKSLDHPWRLLRTVMALAS